MGKLSNNCHFWRALQDDSMESPECVHLGADYHKDCASIAGPIDGNIESFLNTDRSTWSAYIEEECQYYGGRREDLEPPPAEVSSIKECHDWGKAVQSLGADYFFYNGITEECQMFATMQSSCSAIGGPETAPLWNNVRHVIQVGMSLVTTATSIAPTPRAGTTQRSSARKRAVTWPLSTHLS